MKIGVVGAGGIGSYLVWALNDLVMSGQLDNAEITVFDDDGVEAENIMYQNFSVDDIGDNKALALATKYAILPEDSNISSKDDLRNFDLVVSCVDNTPTRKLIYELAYESDGPDFIDLRSEGKAYAIFTKLGKTFEQMIDSLPKEEVVGGSCQLQSDKDAGLIQQGNKVVAILGSALVLDRVRGEGKACNIINQL